MKDKTLFSIIIPVYNIEKYIEECVYSILKQDYTDYEIILVDDGSSDSCPQICDELVKKNNCISVIHKLNGGVSAARKDGAIKATGEYIICVDGDDWLADDCLSKIAKVIKSADVDIVCHGSYCCKKNGNNVKILYKQNSGCYSKTDMEREIFPTLIHGSDASYFIPSLWGKAIRKNLFMENILSDRRAMIGEDGACVIPSIFHSHSVYIINECLYYYRFNNESVTKSRKVFGWDWIQIVNNHIAKKIEIDYGDFRKQMSRKITHDIFTVAVTQFYKKDSYKNIVKDIKKHLDVEQFNKAITECDFRHSLMGTLMKFALKNKFLFPVYIYSKLKK